MNFVEVTMDQFYKVINPLDVVVESHAHGTLFKLRHGAVVGKGSGYKDPEDKRFYLREDLIDAGKT